MNVNNPPKEPLGAKDRVYINLSIDSYEPDAMTFNPDTGTYSVERMVPAIDIEYYFTINGAEKYMMDIEKKTPTSSDLELVFVNVAHNKLKNKQKVTPEYVK